jgi:hypothetical protein
MPTCSKSKSSTKSVTSKSNGPAVKSSKPSKGSSKPVKPSKGKGKGKSQAEALKSVVDAPMPLQTPYPTVEQVAPTVETPVAPPAPVEQPAVSAPVVVPGVSPARKLSATKAPPIVVGKNEAGQDVDNLGRVVERQAKSGWCGVYKPIDLAWSDKRARVFTALVKLGAVGPDRAVSNKDVMMVDGSLVSRDTRHQIYHAMVSGWAGLVQLPGVPGYLYYLTPAGVEALKSHTSK